MEMVNTNMGFNGYKMRIIKRILKSLPTQDDYAFHIIGMCRQKFGITAQVYGRSDCDAFLGYDMSDEDWETIKSSEEWLELDESCSDIDLVQAALANISDYWADIQAF